MSRITDKAKEGIRAFVADANVDVPVGFIEAVTLGVGREHALDA